MSDLYGRKYGSSLYQRKKPELYGGTFGGDLYGSHKEDENSISQSELETLPYLQEQKAQADEEKSWLTPVEMVFKLLSMPNSVIANAVQDIGEGKNVDKILEGAWKSATLQRAGSWKTTLFGGQDEGEDYEGKGLFPDQAWSKEKIPILGDIPIIKNIAGTPGDMIGLLGDILLDPTTYMTFGLKSGATIANKSAARFAAKEATKRAIFNASNLDELAKMAKKGFNPATLKELAERSLPKAEKYIQRFLSGKDMAKFREQLFNKSFKEALSMTGQEFTQKMLQGVAEGGTEFMETAAKKLAQGGTQSLKSQLGHLAKNNPGNNTIEYFASIMKGAKDLPEARLKDVYRQLIEAGADTGVKTGGLLGEAIERYSDFSKTLSWYNSTDFANNVAKLGERKVADFFGKELGKGIRPPNFLARGSESIKSAIGRSPVGQFGKALAAKLDAGPIGALKKALNIRNPYQDMLAQMKMDNHYLADMLIHDEINNVEKVFGGIDEKTLDTVRDIIDYGKSKGTKDYISLITDPEVSKMLAGTDARKIAKVIRDERELVQTWFLKETELAKKGLLVEFEPIANYLPHKSQVVSRKMPTRELGSFRPGFTKHQDLSLDLISKQDQAVIKQFLGVDDATAQKIAQMGWSTTNMDLKEMLMYRAHAHARAVSTADMAERFAQFGVKPDVFKTDPNVMASLSRSGENAFVGLREIQTEIPALKGMLFDDDVANILDRIIPVVESDKGLGVIRKAMSYLTTMFKGYATLSPGFHLRNDRSNMFTGFINYGAGFLNPKRKLEGLIVSAYGLYGEEGLKKLTSKIGISDIGINKVLNKQTGGKTYREWAQVMREKGIVSKASMGYNLDEAIEKMGTKEPLVKRLSPFSKENVYFKGSREVGAVVESSARAQGFLIDIEKITGNGAAGSAAIDEAVRNVKKYFFDYEDLSLVEQKILKPIIPFYSWMRKNIALQLDQLVRKPGMMGAVAKTVEASKFDGYDEEDLPDWVRGQGGIPIDEAADGIARIFFPDLPYKDLNQLPVMFDMRGGVPIPRLQPDEAWNNFLSMANPVFKTVTTLSGEGWDPFKKQSLDSTAPAPRAFRILGKNPELFAFIDAAFRAVGIKDGLGLEVDEKTNKLDMDARVAKLIEDNFLLLRRLDDMGDGISLIFPQIEQELEKLTGITGKYDDAQKVLRAMSTGLGLSAKEIDMDKQAEYEFRDALRRAEEERRKDLKKTPGSQRRSPQYYQSYQRRQRRLRSMYEGY